MHYGIEMSQSISYKYLLSELYFYKLLDYFCRFQKAALGSFLQIKSYYYQGNLMLLFFFISVQDLKSKIIKNKIELKQKY